MSVTEMTEDSKAAISRVAVVEFAEFGFHGARTARIARNAGVNKQLLFYYFGSKAGLFTEAVMRAAKVLREAGPMGADLGGGRLSPAERVRVWLGRASAACWEYPQLARLVIRSLDGPDTTASVAEQFLRGLREDLAGEVSAGQGLGFFRDDADPDLVAAHALALVFGPHLLERPPAATALEERSHRWSEATAAWVTRTLSW